MSERKDVGARVARTLCKALGHKWKPWTEAGDERCARCLSWKAGRPPRRRVDP